MKILSMAWTIYDSRFQAFSKNYTGGGLMIKNICEYIGRIHESYLFIGKMKIREMDLGNIHVVGTDSYADTKEDCLDNNEKHLKTMTEAFTAEVEKIKPDIVNFHGIGKLMQHCIKVCMDKNIRFVYTDHLFIGDSTDIIGYDTNVEWEREIYNIPNIKVIAVSTGMKGKILKSFPQILSENITVIPNGTDFTAEWNKGDVYEKYKLDGTKVLLCVGTVNYRKNQCQIIRAFQLLPPHLKDKIKILFCGKDSMNGVLQETIDREGLQEQLIYAGAVSSEEIKKYYSVASGLIMPSYAEGLSIAALEAIAYGIPVIMFSDSECADDLYDENVVCFAKNRTDACLAEAVSAWYKKMWDRTYIVNYSKYFTMERVADDYIRYYKKQLGELNED